MLPDVPPTLLGGAPNFRAVAPFPAADGRRLKPGILYRSGELSRLSEADVALEGTDASPAKIFALILRDPTPRGARLAMDTLYRRKPRAYAPQLGSLFSNLLRGGALPLLIHCHAGKDRTGFFTAMLLAAAGISRDDILADYVETSRFFAAEAQAPQMAAWAEHAFGQTLDIATVLPLAEARPAYLQAAFAAIDDEFGGVETYLSHAVGVSAPELHAFRDLVLE